MGSHACVSKRVISRNGILSKILGVHGDSIEDVGSPRRLPSGLLSDIANDCRLSYTTFKIWNSANVGSRLLR